MKTDLSLLFEKPEKDKQVILTIEPLAPLSIVSTLPGSYYRSLSKPTKFNLCGMFENILGWHIGQKDRKQILKNMKKVFKQKYKISDFDIETSSSGYTSLLGHLFEVELVFVPPTVTRYDDLWTQQLKHNDKRHMDGTANLSLHVIKEKKQLKMETQAVDNNIKLDKREKSKKKDSLINDFVSSNLDKLPMYYTSPTPREFIVIEGAYQIKLSISSYLLNAFENLLKENNLSYLGTNEGWVDLSIKEI